MDTTITDAPISSHSSHAPALILNALAEHLTASGVYPDFQTVIRFTDGAAVRLSEYYSDGYWATVFPVLSAPESAAYALPSEHRYKTRASGKLLSAAEADTHKDEQLHHVRTVLARARYVAAHEDARNARP